MNDNFTDGERLHRALETDVLARTIWGEARGEGETGMRAVACVVLNRVAVAQDHIEHTGRRFWWGNTVVQVCQKPFQFSCWNRSDPNFNKLISVERTTPSFDTAMDIAAQALSGKLDDLTNGADHYHAIEILPGWAKGQAPAATIGRHVFYRLEN